MNIFLAPAKRENLKLSIENSIDYDILLNSKFSTDKIEFIKKSSQNSNAHAWGLSNNNNIKPYLEAIKKDDIILFCDKSLKKFIYSCQVICLIKNDFLNSNLWDKNKARSNPSKWNNIVFVTNIKKLNPPISKNEIMSSINSKYTLQTFYRLKELELQKFTTKFNELISFIIENTHYSESEIAISSTTEISSTSNSINELKNYINSNPEISLDLNPIKTASKSRKNSVFTITNSNNLDLNDNDKKLIGWIGEKFAYDYTSSHLEYILSLINKYFNNHQVYWFNKEVDIYSDFWIDQSIGKGYDIEIRNENETLKFEVKTSFNKINQVTFTSNELLTMKNCLPKQNYFIIFISNLKNIMLSKKIDLFILKNFSTELSADYISYSKSHTLYAQELLKRYKFLQSNKNPRHYLH